MIITLIFLAYFGGTAIMIWLFIYGDSKNTGLKGTVSRFFMEQLPSVTKACVTAVCGESFASSVWGCFDWVVYQRNPLLQILYHVILFGAFIAWLVYGEPLLPTYLVRTPPHSKYEAHIGISLCLFTWVLANYTKPGKITKDNLSCYSHHHFDQLIFTDDVMCGTCNTLKPARSKHCSLCGICVPRFDHHCVWLNQCVGEHNYRYFLLFLLTHSIVFIYFGALLIGIILSPVVEHRMWEMTYRNPVTGEKFKGMHLIMTYLMNHSATLIILAIMAILFGLALFGFLCYHLYLVGKGQTTNESAKWASAYRLHHTLTQCHKNYLDAIADGVQFEYVTPPPQEQELELEPGLEPEQEEGGEKDGCEMDPEIEAEVDIGSNESGSGSEAEAEAEVEAEGGSGSEQGIENLPADVYGRVHRVSKGPDRRHFLRQMVEEDELPYYLVVDPGPCPENSYNQGFWRNLYDIIFPPSEALLAAAAIVKEEKGKEKENGQGRGNTEGDKFSQERSVSSNNSGGRGLRKRKNGQKKGKGKKRK